MNTMGLATVLFTSAQYVVFALAFLRMIVLSRSLTVAEVGVILLGNAIMLMTSVIRTYGLLDYLIAADSVNKELARTCVTFSVVLAIMLALALGGMAGRIETAFDAPGLELMIIVMVFALPIAALAVVSQGMLRRELQFRQLAIARLVSAVCETVTVLSLLALGQGILSAAWGFFVTHSVGAIFVISSAPQYALVFPRFTEIGRVLRGSTLLSAGNFLMSLGDFLPPLLLGRGFDTSSVGYFGRGQTLINFFRQGIETALAPVFQPWFASKNRLGTVQASQAYLRVMDHVSVVTWPGYAYLYLNADLLIPALLGPGWEASIPIAQALCVGGLVSPFAHYGVFFVAAINAPGLRFGMTLTNQGIRLALLLGAVGFGLQAFAWAFTISHFISFMVTGLVLRKRLEISLLSLVGTMRHGAILAGMVGLSVLIVSVSIRAILVSDIVVLAATAIASVAAWLLGLKFLDHALLAQWRTISMRFRR